MSRRRVDFDQVVIPERELAELEDSRNMWRTAAYVLGLAALALLVAVYGGAPNGCAPFQ